MPSLVGSEMCIRDSVYRASIENLSNIDGHILQSLFQSSSNPPPLLLQSLQSEKRFSDEAAVLMWPFLLLSLPRPRQPNSIQILWSTIRQGLWTRGVQIAKVTSKKEGHNWKGGCRGGDELKLDTWSKVLRVPLSHSDNSFMTLRRCAPRQGRKHNSENRQKEI